MIRDLLNKETPVTLHHARPWGSLGGSGGPFGNVAEVRQGQRPTQTLLDSLRNARAEGSGGPFWILKHVRDVVPGGPY